MVAVRTVVRGYGIGVNTKSIFYPGALSGYVRYWELYSNGKQSYSGYVALY